MPGGSDCFETRPYHVLMTGRTGEIGSGAALAGLAGVSDALKEDHGRDGFAAPGKTSTEAFMRTLRREDPAVAIYRASAVDGVCAATLCELPCVPDIYHGPQ